MIQSVSISSKRQITIPVSIFKSLNLSQGDSLVVEAYDNKIVMQKSKDILDRLAGSLVLPKRFTGLSLDDIIEKAKKEYFEEK